MSIAENSPVENRPVLVVDFGAQYAQLIARRVREARVYSEIVPSTMSASDMLAKNPAAIILSGGPSSVYAEGAPSLDPAVLEAGVPVLGICYGFQVMAALAFVLVPNMMAILVPLSGWLCILGKKSYEGGGEKRIPFSSS